MPNEDTGLQNTKSSNNLSLRDLAFNEEPPQRRYTEGSTFRESLRRDANVISNIYLDIPHPIRRSLSEDFQDSFEFANSNPEMAFSGGTNSLPAFLSGSSSGQHSALLQQMQSSHRAVDNDYCEQPPPCHFIQAQTRSSSRNTRTNTDLARHTRRHRQQHREPSGRRPQTRSSSRQRSSREDGTHPAFRDGLVTTSADRYTTSNHHRNMRFDEPPPRPPLSTYHVEHRRAERVLRVTASLPASLSFNSGESSLVPMRYNALPSRHHHSSRHRTTNSSRQFVMGTQRGYSLTPPPVCRANKPRYDAHNRLIQTVSSPSVVTQCIDSSMSNLLQSHGHRSIVRPTPKVAQPSPRNVEKSIEDIKKENSISQPTHVVISQQPKRKSKKQQRQEELENDEIAREKRGLVVSLNNNVTKNSKSTTTKKSKNVSSKKSSISSKLIDNESTKKEERTPMLPATKDSRQETEESTNPALPFKSGEPCPRCGKCGEESQGRKTDSDNRSSSSSCSQRCCVCSVDTCVETATCYCCAKGVFYHCLSHEDEETFADKPCSCHSEKCCLRWTLLGMLSLCLPCLCCYPIARGCVKLCRSCSKRSKSRNDSYR